MRGKYLEAVAQSTDADPVILRILQRKYTPFSLVRSRIPRFLTVSASGTSAACPRLSSVSAAALCLAGCGPVHNATRGTAGWEVHLSLSQGSIHTSFGTQSSPTYKTLNGLWGEISTYNSLTWVLDSFVLSAPCREEINIITASEY